MKLFQKYGIGAILLFLAIIVGISLLNSLGHESKMMEAKDAGDFAYEELRENTVSSTGFVIYLSLAMVIIAALVALVLPLVKSMSNPKSLMLPVGSLVALVVLFFIFRAMADPNIPGDTSKYTGESGWTLAGGLITLSIVLLAIAVVLMLVGKLVLKRFAR